MSTNFPTKSSSRAGRFKKKLVPEAFLEKEAPVIQDRMAPVLRDFESGQFSPAEFCGLYILTVLAYRYPGSWLGSKRPHKLVEHHQLNHSLTGLKKGWEPNIQKRLEGMETVGDLFSSFAFQSTPLTVNRSILNWSTGAYALELMFRIPRPEEVLHQQKRGHRCVTVVLDKEKASRFILGQRDALGFTMHDLIHADHFYHNNQSFQGQLGFYGFLDYCLQKQHFQEHLQMAAFEAEFEYLIADMNAYAIHLMKCFKSALIHYHQQGNEFFAEWVKKIDVNQEELDALLSLNTQHYHTDQDAILLKFLSRFENATSHISTR